MYEWEQRKLVTEAIEKEAELQRKEKARMEKEVQKERSYAEFKKWLKHSLIKQREDQLQKKIHDH